MLGFLKKKKIELVMPIEGKLIKIEDVPDPAFSQKMLGDGFAIEPSDGKVYSPVDGKVIQRFPTNHAIGLETKEGLEILIHFGINTVELKGEGFVNKIEVGDEVKKGQLLLEVDIDYVKDNEKPLTTPIVFTNFDKVKTMDIEYGENKIKEPCVQIKLK